MLKSNLPDLFAGEIIFSPLHKRFNAPFTLFKIFWGLFINLDRWAYSRYEGFDRNSTENIQKRKLSYLLTHARNNTQYWKNIVPVIKGRDPVKILEAVPILTRDIIKKNDIKVFIAENIPSWRYEFIHTSGTTTNSPLNFYGDKFSSLRMEGIMQHILEVNPRGRLMRFNLPFPSFVPSCEFFGINFSKKVDRKTLLWAGKKILSSKITHILSPTSQLLVLANMLGGEGMKLPIRAAGVVGEHLLEKDRVFMQNVFRCPVFNIYASKEAGGPLAYECGRSTGWHINNACFFWEILDETNNPVKEGEDGDIVLTMLESELMPFIRYKIGDRGRILPGPCLCGRKNPRLIFTGRKIEFITLRDGRPLPLLSLVRMIRDFAPPIDQFQFEQKEPGRITVKLVPLRTDEDTRIDNMLSAIRDGYKDELEVRIEVVERIPGKSVLFKKII